MPENRNRNHSETTMKPDRNCSATICETIKRNRATVPIGEGAMVAPLARGLSLRAPDPRLRLRYAEASLRRAARRFERKAERMRQEREAMRLQVRDGLNSLKWRVWAINALVPGKNGITS